jgi:hypothetical protein
VEEVEAEVEQRARDGCAVDLHVLLGQVPAARAHQQHGGLLVQRVLLAVRGEVDGAAHGVAQVDLALDHVRPGRRVESSKSAMNTLAPEFSALMIILRSTGPVISTRRSCRSAGNP